MLCGAGCRCIYSASWDCTVRIWNRETLRRESLLAFPDWVHAAKPRGGHLLVCPSSPSLTDSSRLCWLQSV